MNQLQPHDPQQSELPRSLPRWVIPTAVGGALLSFLLLLGFAGSLFWLTAQAPLLAAASSNASEVRPEAETGPGSPSDPGSDVKPPGGDFLPDSKGTPDLKSPGTDSPGSDFSGALGPAAEVQQLADKYLEASSDGTIYDLVPGGKRVDPSCIGAFLYVLTDLKSASRFGGSTAELQQLLDKAHAYEERFLAGEDLDTSVKITRGDGSVFESDGKYRLID